ncbi:hypothetical protein [Paraburkholderia fungorum]|jgi:hypothetical protein|uniref:hypothetical protein n=1 Tax=Paraburkholderia fungorum TaxID=134537 RepID=UPI000D055939|nr:hypothetical protein [Paraburkholderia fungorum]PRZ45358.1 hypothetical protein BX589_13937 [Paraburkholderia fungorum]
MSAQLSTVEKYENQLSGLKSMSKKRKLMIALAFQVPTLLIFNYVGFHVVNTGTDFDIQYRSLVMGFNVASIIAYLYAAANWKQVTTD